MICGCAHRPGGPDSTAENTATTQRPDATFRHRFYKKGRKHVVAPEVYLRTTGSYRTLAGSDREPAGLHLVLIGFVL